MRAGIFWARCALFANLVGTFLVFLSFQGTSSDFRFITSKGLMPNGKESAVSTNYSICVNDYTLAATDAVGGLMLGSKKCPNWNVGNPAAVVIAEYPILAYVGLLLSAFGFLVQFLLTFRLPELIVDPPSGGNRQNRRQDNRERRR